MRSVEDAVRDERFLRSLDAEGLSGLATVHLLEKSDIRDFTDEGYDPEEVVRFSERQDVLQEAFSRGVMDDFWNPVFDFLVNNRFANGDSDVELQYAEVKNAYDCWPIRLRAKILLNVAENDLCHAFRSYIRNETDRKRKASYGFLEAKALSMVPNYFSDMVARRLDSIHPVLLPMGLRPDYKRAKDYFIG